MLEVVHYRLKGGKQVKRTVAGSTRCRVVFAVVMMACLIGMDGITGAIAQAQKPIKIGFSMALSGPLPPAGKAAVLAMELWAEDVNAKGGLLGRPVKLIHYDDHSKPADVPPIYTKLINIDRVDFVVSPYGTALIAPALPIVMEHNMVFPGLFGLAVNEAFKYPYYFQIMPAGPDPYYDWTNGFFGVAGQQEPKPQTAALLAVDNEYGVNALQGARKSAKEVGLKIVYDKRYPPGTVDFTPILRAIKATKAEVVFVASYPAGSVGVVKAAKEINLVPKIFGGGLVGLQYTAIQTNLGPTLNGIVNYWFWAPEPTLKFPGIEDFLQKYQAKAKDAGLDPLGYYLPPWAYAYVQVLGQAIEGAKSMEQAAVGDYIRSNTFDTIVGKIKFAPNGEWAESRTLMVQLQNIKSRDLSEFSAPGKMVVIHPKPYKSGDIIYPFPGWQ